VNELAAAASDSGAAKIGDPLPILALALKRMVAGNRLRDDEGRIDLTREEARSFIDTAVREAIDDANAGQDELRHLVIPRLASWDRAAETRGAARSLVASDGELFAGPREGLRDLADALVSQGLLTRSGSGEGAVYEIAHDALLRVPPLGPVIEARRHKFEPAHNLEIKAREWNEAGRTDDRLSHRGAELSEASNLLKDEDFGPDLRRPESGVEAYIKACTRQEERRQKPGKPFFIRIATFFIVLLGGIGILVSLQPWQLAPLWAWVLPTICWGSCCWISRSTTTMSETIFRNNWGSCPAPTPMSPRQL
jgi:hypothetical protein